MHLTNFLNVASAVERFAVVILHGVAVGHVEVGALTAQLDLNLSRPKETKG